MAQGLRSPITTHILDTALGRPAEGVHVVLERMDSGANAVKIGEGHTDKDGRVGTLMTPSPRVDAGTYRLTFFTEDYFTRNGQKSFYPFVQVVFKIEAQSEHYHVPLLLNPFGYSTYRGS